MSGTRTTDAERLDALRRRLYAPDATEEDVAAYRAATERSAADAPAQEHRPAPDARPSRRGRVLVVVGAAALVATAIAVLVTAHPLAAVTASGASASPSVPAAPRLVGGEIPTSVASRAGFVQRLQDGSQPRLLDFLYSHGAYLPAIVGTPQRVASTEYAGQGPSTIPLEPSDLAQRGGRVTVILVLDRPATYSWRAQRVVWSSTRSAVLEVAEQAGTGRAGVPTTARFQYTGRAPTRLAVYTDETVKWGAVVVFTD